MDLSSSCPPRDLPSYSPSVRPSFLLACLGLPYCLPSVLHFPFLNSVSSFRPFIQPFLPSCAPSFTPFTFKANASGSNIPPRKRVSSYKGTLARSHQHRRFRATPSSFLSLSVSLPPSLPSHHISIYIYIYIYIYTYICTVYYTFIYVCVCTNKITYIHE
jgi:hypothetical protein